MKGEGKMKKLWDNSSKLYKAIAIVLTLIMVVTPLYIHFEKRYDAKAASGPSIELMKKDSEGNWQSFTDGIAYSGEYKYVVTANDASDIYYSTDGGNTVTLLSETDIEISYEADSSKYKIIKYTMDGNEITTGIEFPEIVWDKDDRLNLSVSATLNSVNFDGGNLFCKKDDVLKITITTGFDLTRLSILGNDIDNLSTIGYTENNYVRTYTYEYRFSGDTNTDDFTNKDIVVKDEKTTGEGEKITCASLIYDVTAPTISENSTGILDTTKIYKTYTYYYIIKSGDSSVESAIDTAYYKINDGTEKTIVSNGVAQTGVTINSTTGEVTGSITDIPNISADGTKITLYAKDKAGNDKTEEFTVVIDGLSPVINYVKVKKDNTEYFSSSFASEWFNANDTMSINASDGVKLQKISVLNSSDDSELSSTGDLSVTEYTYEGSIYELLGKASAQALDDGTYNIKVKVDDYAVSSTDLNDTTNNSDTKSYTLNIDSTAPSYETPELRTSGPDYNKVDSMLLNNIYYINKETELTGSTDGLYYAVKISDTTSGVKNETVKLYNSSNNVVAAISNGTVATPGTRIADYYMFEIPFKTQTVGTPQTYTIKGEDKAGNEFTIAELPQICVIDSDINFKNLTFTGVDGISLTGDDIENLKYSNQVYTISFDVESGYEIKEIGIADGDAGSPNVIVKKDSFSENGYNSTTKLYKQHVSFDIPAPVLGNVSFDRLRIYAKDSKETPHRQGEKPLELLMYDSTLPVVRAADETSNITVDNAWYKSYTLSAIVLSGLNNTTESDLEEAKYSITGSDSAADVNLIISGSKTNASDITVPESNNIGGTTITFSAKDKAGNVMTSTNEPNSFTIKVDATAPTINSLTAGGNEANSVALTGNPQIAVNFGDNLTIGASTITITLPDGSNKLYNYSDAIGEQKDIKVINSFALSTLIGKAPSDGTYKVRLDVADKAGNPTSKEITFDIDNTAPEFTASIISGTSGKGNGYYNSNVVVRFTAKDNNFDASDVTVTDNGSALSPSWSLNDGMYIADVTISAEGRHDIVIKGTDKSGTSGASKSVGFTIDKTAPTVALLLNGGTIYNESMGALNLTGAANINVSITDTNIDSEDLRVQVIKTVPDTATTTTEYMPTSNRNFTFTDEADYVINIYAVDLANNESSKRTISFRIDTAAPTLTISGANGGTSSSAVSVGFNITESFWQDASGTVNIYRKAGDGQEESLYKTLTITPTQRAYTLSELLSDTGVYRFEFEARDKVGHTAQTEQSITIDRNKPDIRLTGVNNYDVTDGLVSIAVTVSDEFYQSKTVSATGTLLRADGTRSIVGFSPFSASGNPTSIEQTFSEDGIYDISISSRDIAGNESISKVHFTIDTTAPVIKDLSEYDGKTFNSIDLDMDLDELVSDLTVCDVRMYLNGSEYDGVSDIEDGSYTLLITAEDELGHKSEKSATFVLDTKAPVFIVTGVEDGDVKEENYDIEISLQLDEDVLTSVKLNDKDVLLSNNNTTATLKVTDRGVYELYMAAVDPAGNEAEQTISFVYGDEEMAAAALDDTVSKTDSKSGRWWIWLIAAAVILGGGGFFIILLKRRKNN